MFSFGKNWKSFLSILTEAHIEGAQRALSSSLGIQDMHGLTFLDIGCGSGLHSLAAMRLGAENVLSFDYDDDSVGCCAELKKKHYPDAAHWRVLRGSVLDTEFVNTLGTWDIVYAWGVLHHTGNMGKAFENVAPLSRNLLFLSIYNDQGPASRRWKRIKRLYNASIATRWLVLAIFVPYLLTRACLGALLRHENPVRKMRNYKVNNRGMSVFHDLIDWLGGYPFEVASPEVVFKYFKSKGYELEHLKTCGGGLGCNEYVFKSRSPRVFSEASQVTANTSIPG